MEIGKFHEQGLLTNSSILKKEEITMISENIYGQSSKKVPFPRAGLFSMAGKRGCVERRCVCTGYIMQGI